MSDQSNPENVTPDDPRPASPADSPQSAAPSAPSATPAGWYPDPQAPGSQRYWDGQAWAAPQQPQYVVAPAKYTPPDATTTLVVAILSLMVCPFLAIWSYTSAKKAKKDAEAMGMQLDGTANIAYIISIIGLVYIAIWLVLVVLVFLPLMILPFFAVGAGV